MDADASVPYRRLVHVPSLDILRAFAVTIVVLSHIWEVAPYYHYREIFSNSGFLGVDLFFVLSGFLITALLLQEQHDTGTIRLRQLLPAPGVPSAPGPLRATGRVPRVRQRHRVGRPSAARTSCSTACDPRSSTS